MAQKKSDRSQPPRFSVTSGGNGASMERRKVLGPVNPPPSSPSHFPPSRAPLAAVRCRALPCAAVRCHALPRAAVRCRALPCAAVRCRASLRAAMRYCALLCAAGSRP